MFIYSSIHHLPIHPLQRLPYWVRWELRVYSISLSISHTHYSNTTIKWWQSATTHLLGWGREPKHGENPWDTGKSYDLHTHMEEVGIKHPTLKVLKQKGRPFLFQCLIIKNPKLCSCNSLPITRIHYMDVRVNTALYYQRKCGVRDYGCRLWKDSTTRLFWLRLIEIICLKKTSQKQQEMTQILSQVLPGKPWSPPLTQSARGPPWWPALTFQHTQI